MEVWGRYKFAIGDLTFDAQDACAAACEIASRGIACLATAEDVLPVHKRVRFPSMVGSEGAVELRSWQDAHRSIIAAKIVYRRAYPERPQGRRDTDARRSRQMGMRSPPSKTSRPGLLFRPMASPKSNAVVRILFSVDLFSWNTNPHKNPDTEISKAAFLLQKAASAGAVPRSPRRGQTRTYLALG